MAPVSRVLLTVDAVGGVWQYGIDLARALGSRGVETVIALLGPAPTPEQRAEAAAILTATLVETGLPLDWMCDGPAPVLAAGEAITRLAIEANVDLVQFNMPTLAAATRPSMPVIAVTHGCVATWWEAANPGEPLAPEYRWHRSLTAEGLRAADMVVAPSDAYGQIVARHYGLSEQPLTVHNGRIPGSIAAHDVSGDFAFTAGRLWDRVKNSALLDRVAARLSIPFHAAGALRGPHGEMIALAQLRALGQIDTPALDAWLAQRPVFVSAASFEPFGLAVLEAASAGCPLVLSDIPAFRELWDGAATFVEHQDEDAYARTIEAIFADPARRAALGSAARARALRYTPAAMADGMMRLYARALADTRPTGKVAA